MMNKYAFVMILIDTSLITPIIYIFRSPSTNRFLFRNSVDGGGGGDPNPASRYASSSFSSSSNRQRDYSAPFSSARPSSWAQSMYGGGGSDGRIGNSNSNDDASGGGGDGGRLQDWILMVKHVVSRDSGAYECQVGCCCCCERNIAIYDEENIISMVFSIKPSVFV